MATVTFANFGSGRGGGVLKATNALSCTISWLRMNIAGMKAIAGMIKTGAPWRWLGWRRLRRLMLILRMMIKAVVKDMMTSCCPGDIRIWITRSANSGGGHASTQAVDTMYRCLSSLIRASAAKDAVPALGRKNKVRMGRSANTLCMQPCPQMQAPLLPLRPRRGSTSTRSKFGRPSTSKFAGAKKEVARNQQNMAKMSLASSIQLLPLLPGEKNHLLPTRLMRFLLIAKGLLWGLTRKQLQPRRRRKNGRRRRTSQHLHQSLRG